MISINGLHKSFGKLDVLQDIGLELATPGVIAILGPNGSGKSTLIKLILGLVLPTHGSITVLGESIDHSYQYRKYISYLPQIARFPDNLKVRELLDVIEDIRGKSRIKASLIDYFGIETFLNNKLGHLSGGTRQKVNLVITFMYDTPIRILDEPSAGLDPIAMVALKKLIEEERKQDKLIVLTTHIIPMVESMANDLIFLLEGSIYFHGAPGELKRKTETNNLEEAIAKLMIRSGTPIIQSSANTYGSLLNPKMLKE